MSEHANPIGQQTQSPATAGTAPGAPANSASNDPGISVAGAQGTAGNMALATPEFDRQEVTTFGRDDGHAVTVIGKMLVGFFFYSLLVMIAVACWTMGRGGQVEPNSHPDHEAEEVAE